MAEKLLQGDDEVDELDYTLPLSNVTSGDLLSMASHSQHARVPAVKPRGEGYRTSDYAVRDGLTSKIAHTKG